jgi:polar amino acid transport system substrate-binding protein
MPLAELRGDVLQRGILKDLGELIAERAGLKARFVPVPPKRVAAALAAGEADAVCHVAQGWVEGELHWSRPLLDYTGVVASRQGTPPLRRLKDLADQPVGTVAAYHYPEVIQALGPRFRRDDAPSMGSNLRKLAAGRTRYALTEKLTLGHAMREHPELGLVAALQTVSYPTHCVFGLHRPLPLAALDRAIDALVSEGHVERLLARYR